jgi:salicylate hydroxylase
MSQTNKTRFHLPDGPEQKQRDADMAQGATDWSFAAIAWLYEHDASVIADATEPGSPAPVVNAQARH